MNRKQRRLAAEAAAAAQVETQVQAEVVETTTAQEPVIEQVEVLETTEVVSIPEVSPEELARQAAEAEAIDTLIGKVDATPAVTETGRARANRRHTVGSAVDGTIFQLGGDKGEPKARPNTLAGALYDELKVNGPGTCSELVDRLNRDGVYERVALKSATLRPYSSVAYWLKTWRADGLATVVIPGAEPTEQPAVEPAAELAMA